MDAGAGPVKALHDLRVLILGFTAGVLFTQTLADLPALFTLALAAIPVLIPWRGRLLYAAAVLGVLYSVLRAQPFLDQRWPAGRHGGDLTTQGTIASLPERGADSVRFMFVPTDETLPRRVRVSWYRDFQPVRGGECWQLTLRMRTPHGSMNPGSFDYEGWLFQQGIGATASVREAVRCESSHGNPILRMRQHIADRLQAWVPEPKSRALLAALTIGDRSGFSDDDWDAFRLTGTTHLVAISGFNIGIAAAASFFLLRWLWSLVPRLCLWIPAQRVALLGSALVAFAYALLAGFEPPVQRAVVMLWVILAAAWTYRLAEASRVLALAWLAVLLLDPFATLSAGTWLSFGAVAVIFYVALGRRESPGFWLAALKVQLALAVALIPLSLYFFHGTSLIAPLVNLVAVPLFAVLTPLALGSLLLSLVFPASAWVLLMPVSIALQKVSGTLLVPLSYPELWFAASPMPYALGLGLIGIALLFTPRGLPLKPLGVLCLLPLFSPVDRAPKQGFELTALDVGQGLAIVVRTSNHSLLFDAGPAFDAGFDAGESVVVPYLLSQGVTRLDRMMISHTDLDHRGGAPAVRRLMTVGDEMGALAGEPCRQGQSWEWDGVHFEVLNGPMPGLSINNGGCVLKIESPEYSALLPADIEKKAEQRLLQEMPERLRADVLIAPHHGSKTSSTEAFVQAVNPAVVIYAAGWRNHFKHPRPEVVARYAELESLQYVTGNVGALTVRADLSVDQYRLEAARFWNSVAEMFD